MQWTTSWRAGPALFSGDESSLRRGSSPWIWKDCTRLHGESARHSFVFLQHHHHRPLPHVCFPPFPPWILTLPPAPLKPIHPPESLPQLFDRTLLSIHIWRSRTSPFTLAPTTSSQQNGRALRRTHLIVPLFEEQRVDALIETVSSELACPTPSNCSLRTGKRLPLPRELAPLHSAPLRACGGCSDVECE